MCAFYLKLLAAIFFIASNFLSISAFAQYGGGAPVYSSWTAYGNITGNPAIAATSTVVQLPPASSGTTGSAGLTAKICNLGTVDVFLSFGTSSAVTAAVGAGSWLPFGTCGAFNLKPFVATQYTWLAGICNAASCSVPIYVETGIGTPNLH